MKTFKIRQNVGSIRHLVSFHDGVKTHQDKSPLLDARTFSRKKDANKFVEALKTEGYVQSEQPIMPITRDAVQEFLDYYEFEILALDELEKRMHLTGCDDCKIIDPIIDLLQAIKAGVHNI